MSYYPIIGLEVHVELATKSGMFCGCPADSFGKEPNTNVCPVCLGLPGALPVPNKKAIEWTIMLGLALGCNINELSYFERKNYFYPDLPKGYQISQNVKPFCYEGKLGNIRINNIHLEEDTGKLIHQGEETFVDFNRSGVPLVEIVTEPDFRSIEEVDVYLKKLQRIIRYLGISNADMEKGSMRLEPSISMAKIKSQKSKVKSSNQNSKLLDGLDLPEYRVELKNINSFRFCRRALEFEIHRQTEMLESGKTTTQETRGWNEIKNLTFPQRSKEEAHDYRYFPEPDIPPIRFAQDKIEELKTKIGELPEAKANRFINQYGLTEYQAGILTEQKEMADYYEKVVGEMREMGEMRVTIANWIINKKIDWQKEPPESVAKKVAASQQTVAVDEKELEKIVQKVLAENPKVLEDYKNGKTQVLGVLIGKVVGISGADPRTVKTFLENYLPKPAG